MCCELPGLLVLVKSVSARPPCRQRLAWSPGCSRPGEKQPSMMRLLCILALGRSRRLGLHDDAAGRLATADGTARRQLAQPEAQPPTDCLRERARRCGSLTAMTALAAPTRASPMCPPPTGTTAPSAPSGPISGLPAVRRQRTRQDLPPAGGAEGDRAIGSIPQVRRTKGYWESNYALQNECGLSFGASTAPALLTLTLTLPYPFYPFPYRSYPHPNPNPDPNPNPNLTLT